MLSKRVILIYILIIFNYFKVYATHDYVLTGSRSFALANSSVALNDFWAINYNQANIAGFNSFTCGASFENKYAVKELSSKCVGLILPTNTGVFGLSFNNFGYNAYNENKIGLSYAKNLNNMFSAGIQLDYLNSVFSEYYGNKQIFTFEIGINSKISKNLTLGLHVFNPIKQKSDNILKIPSIVKLGFLYHASDKGLITIELEKKDNYNPEIKFGAEYIVYKNVFIRTGIQIKSGKTISNQINNFFGFGFRKKRFNIDVSSGIDWVLGITPQISLIYQFSENN